MEHIDFTQYQDAGDLKKITQKPFMQMNYLIRRYHYPEAIYYFVLEPDKSKLAVQQGLQELETLKNLLCSNILAKNKRGRILAYHKFWRYQHERTNYFRNYTSDAAVFR